VVM
jgi:mfd: transcription-repair coupling factor